MPTFNCRFTALVFGPGHDQPREISRSFKLHAETQEDAVYKIVGELGEAYHEMANPNFTFGPTKGYRDERSVH